MKAKKRKKVFCGCTAFFDQVPLEENDVDWCSLHANAGAMLRMLKWAVVRFEVDEFEATEWMLDIIIRTDPKAAKKLVKAIAKKRGK